MLQSSHFHPLGRNSWGGGTVCPIIANANLSHDDRSTVAAGFLKACRVRQNKAKLFKHSPPCVSGETDFPSGNMWLSKPNYTFWLPRTGLYVNATGDTISALIHSQEHSLTSVTGTIFQGDNTLILACSSRLTYTPVSQADQCLVSLLDMAVVAPRGKLHVYALKSLSFRTGSCVRVKILLE